MEKHPWKGLKPSGGGFFTILVVGQNGKTSLEGFETSVLGIYTLLSSIYGQNGKTSLEGFETSSSRRVQYTPWQQVRMEKHPWKGLKQI